MKTILIVGGGYAGVSVAKALEKQKPADTRIILIEKRSHLYHCVAGLRAGVENLDEQIFIPYDKLFTQPQNTVIQGLVSRFDANAVYLETAHPEHGSQINYDYLVIATGTRYPAPARVDKLSLKEGKQQLADIRQKVNGAKHILIVGGGPVGIEMAGELSELPDKKVTLVHDQSQLGAAAYMTPKVSDALLKLLHASNVRVSLSDSVALPPLDGLDSVFVPATPLAPTKNKNVALDDVDLVILAFGNRPDSAWVKNSFPELVQPNQYIKVRPTLQVDHPTLKNVFVIGDIADLKESKLAFRTKGHGEIAATNITRLIGAKDASLKEYQKGPDMMLVTYGKSKGVVMLPYGIVLGNWVAKTLKAKTLLLDRFWKEMNQPQMPPLSSELQVARANNYLLYTLLTLGAAGLAIYMSNLQK